MKLSWEVVTLTLKSTFRIAHGVSKQRQNVIVHLDEGLGEAAAVSYHGETPAGIAAYLSQLSPLLDIDPQHLYSFLAALPAGSPAARAGVDIALHDLWGKHLGHPLYRLLGLDPEAIPPTSFTIAMDTPQVMAQQAQASGMPILKIKVGAGEDVARIRAIRQVTDAKLRLDANAGWSHEQAVHLIPRLAEYDLEMVEQPLPVGDIEGLKWLRRQGFGVPIFVDESIKTPADVIAHAGAVDGVVIKLAKSGGIRGALQAIAVARALDMRVMISCMVETTVGVTAAAHLAPLCDYVDLDGPLLIANDPYVGVSYEGARLVLPDTPGLGVRLATKPERDQPLSGE